MSDASSALEKDRTEKLCLQGQRPKPSPAPKLLWLHTQHPTSAACTPMPDLAITTLGVWESETPTAHIHRILSMLDFRKCSPASDSSAQVQRQEHGIL